jgi:phosphoglycolate phosphatase-like HAD superfamily hydrolase
MIKAIFFDFDGVILESAGIKAWAYNELFKGEKKFRQIQKYCQGNSGKSRYVKIDYVSRHFLSKPLSKSAAGRMAQRYSTLVYKKVLACSWVPGARAFLDKFHGKLRFFLISGTPQPELRRIVKQRGMGKYFDAVHGAPASKTHWGRHLLKKYNLSPSDVVMIGDGREDFRSAKSLRVPFVGRRTSAVSLPRSVRSVRDLRSFERALKIKGLLNK